ncbi:MAG: RluA family pseudouridine synthase [Defluviitaleaceae bacterium]|nr:RluA family pseudouridine synthase [Defluviitaleaceae bacterium]
MQEVKITEQTAGQRLDKFLARYFGAAPKTFLHKMLRKKNIVVNDKRAEGALILSDGDTITLYLSDETVAKFTKARTSYAGTLDIIFEDEHIIIINKPANLLTQPDSTNSDSVTSRLRHIYADAAFAPVAINRLDRNTTGIVLCAKTLAASQILAKLIHYRKIEKNYIAIAHGKITENLLLEGHHVKDAKSNISKIVKNVPRGTFSKEVLTKVKPIKYNTLTDTTMLKIKLETGRSHQIRTHLVSIGHPLVGDTKYGGKGAKRQMLHASEIVFGDTGGILGYLTRKRFEAKLPEDMRKYSEK